MRSLAWALIQYDWCLKMGKSGHGDWQTQTEDTQGRRPCEEGGRDGVSLPPAKKCLGPPDTGGSQEKSSPSGSGESTAWLTPRLQTSASRTVRQWISAVLSPLVCGALLWQPQETHTARKQRFSAISLLESELSQSGVRKGGVTRGTTETGLGVSVTVTLSHNSVFQEAVEWPAHSVQEEARGIVHLPVSSQVPFISGSPHGTLSPHTSVLHVHECWASPGALHASVVTGKTRAEAKWPQRAPEVLCCPLHLHRVRSAHLEPLTAVTAEAKQMAKDSRTGEAKRVCTGLKRHAIKFSFFFFFFLQFSDLCQKSQSCLLPP